MTENKTGQLAKALSERTKISETDLASLGSENLKDYFKRSSDPAWAPVVANGAAAAIIAGMLCMGGGTGAKGYAFGGLLMAAGLFAAWKGIKKEVDRDKLINEIKKDIDNREPPGPSSAL